MVVDLVSFEGVTLATVKIDVKVSRLTNKNFNIDFGPVVKIDAKENFMRATFNEKMTSKTY